MSKRGSPGGIWQYLLMKSFKTFWKSAFAFGFAIGLVVSAGLQGVDAQTNDAAP